MEPFEVEPVEDLQPLVAHGGNEGLDPLRLKPLQQLIGQVTVSSIRAGVKRIHPGRLAEDTSGGGIEVLDPLGAEGDQSSIRIAIRVQQPFEPVPDADHLPSQSAPRQGRAHQHGIHARDEARPDVDGDAPVSACMTQDLDHGFTPGLFSPVRPKASSMMACRCATRSSDGVL